MELDEPVPYNCPSCGNAEATRWRGPYYHDYACPSCGEFSMSRTQEGFLKRPDGTFKEGHFIESDSRRWLSSRITDEMLDYEDCRPVRAVSELEIDLPEWLKTELAKGRTKARPAKPE